MLSHALRLGVIACSDGIPGWQARAVAGLGEGGLAEVSAVWTIASERSPTAGPGAARRPLREVFGPLTPTPLGDVTAATRVDFVLDLTDGAAPLPALIEARWGVWRWVFCDERGRVDGPSLVRLLGGGSALIEALLVRTDVAGQRVVLSQGVFKATPHRPQRCRAAVHEAVTRWPAQAARRLVEDGNVPDVSPAFYDLSRPTQGRHGSPAWTDRAKLALRLPEFQARHSLRKYVDEQWVIGVLPRPVESLLADPRVDDAWWIVPPPGRFYADPFALDAAHLLVEVCDMKTGHGSIAALHLDTTDHPAGAEVRIDPIPVLDLPQHLSYPYVLQADGQTWMIPEKLGLPGVHLYRAQATPREWAHDQTLIPGLAAVDPTVFAHDGRWWLTCGDASQNPETKLMLYWADALTGPWHAHPMNPIVCDPRRARSAGRPFVHDGALYRPAQDCATSYGRAVTLNRIEELSTTRYRERPAVRIEPSPTSAYTDGLHTVCGWGEMTLIDAKRHFVTPASVLRRTLRLW